MKRVTAMLTGLLISTPLLTEKTQAADWERGAGLSLSTEFSDNICLSNDDKKSEAFTVVTPNLRLRGEGARANVSLDGNVRYNSLADADVTCPSGQRPVFANRERFLPSIRYVGDLELIEDWLILESDASARTTNIDSFAPGNASGLDGRDNVNIVYRYGAGALMQRRLGDADMRLRYNYNEQSNGVRLLGDSSENRGEFSLDNARDNNRLTLSVSGQYSELEYEGTELIPAFDNKLSSAEARAALRLGSSWQVSAMGGEEWNEFISLSDDIDGSYWDASLSWSPNDRVSVEVGTGERFFGSSPHASIRYRHKRVEFTAGYNRSVNLPRDLRAASGSLIDPFDPDFDPGNDPIGGIPPGQVPGLPPILEGDPTFIGNSPLINEQLRLGLRYSGQRTTMSISASESVQKRLEDFSEATFSSVGVTMSRSLSSNLSANLSVNYSEREGRGGSNVGVFGETSETWRGVFGLSRRLGTDTTVSIDYQYNRRDSDSVLNTYEENRVVLSARHQF